MASLYLFALTIFCRMRKSLIIFAFAISSCNSKTPTEEKSPIRYNAVTRNENLIKIKVELPAEALRLSQVSGEYNIVRPDSKEDHMFGEIGQLKVMSDKYVIFDDISSSVLLFDKQGKFVSKIKAGSVDSINLQSIDAIDTYQDKIYIKSSKSNNVSVFTPDGHLLKQNKLRFFYKNFMVLNGREDLLMNTDKLINYTYASDTLVPDCANMYIFTPGESQHQVGQSSLTNTPKLRRYFPFSRKMFPNGSLRYYVHNPFSRSGNEVYYNLVFSDTIYSVTSPDVVKPKYVIDFGDHKSTFNLLDKTGDEIAGYFNKQASEAFMVSNFFETPSFIHFGYVYAGRYYTAIYSKASGKTITGILENDLFAQELMFIAADGDDFLATVKPYKMKEAVKNSAKSNADPKALRELASLSANMTDNDNEMIVRCKFKAF
jgi:hypothetical protein